MAILVAGAGSSASLAAQSDAPPRISLGPQTGEVSRGFTDIEGFVELPDGRLLISDAGEEVLYSVTFDGSGTGRVEQVGRRGDGPREYLRPGRLFPIGGDTLLMQDAWRARWSILVGTDLVDVIMPNRPAAQALSSGYALGVAGDVWADVVGVSWSRAAVARIRLLADSVAIRISSRPWASLDEVPPMDTIRMGMVGAGPGGSGGCAVGTGSGATSMCGDLVPLQDHAAIFPDGWIAVAYFDPYRVSWRSPDGRWTEGPTVERETVRMNSLERCAAAQGWDFRGMGACDGDTNFGPRPLPDAHPPFARSSSSKRSLPGSVPVLAAPDGRLLVRRTPTARNFMFTRYDVFERSGLRVGQIQLNGSDAILGFGEGTVYTVRTDPFDLQWVYRHAWPSPE